MHKNEPEKHEGCTKKQDKLNSDRILVFSLGQEYYGTDLLKVKEVIALPDIRPIPHTPSHFKGIMNLRGQLISVIDLCTRLGMKKTETAVESAIVILEIGALSLGMIVDSVESVLAVEPHEVNPAPDIDSKTCSKYITGVVRKDKRLILLLNIELALNVDEINALKNSVTSAAA